MRCSQILSQNLIESVQRGFRFVRNTRHGRMITFYPYLDILFGDFCDSCGDGDGDFELICCNWCCCCSASSLDSSLYKKRFLKAGASPLVPPPLPPLPPVVTACEFLASPSRAKSALSNLMLDNHHVKGRVVGGHGQINIQCVKDREKKKSVSKVSGPLNKDINQLSPSFSS